MEAQRITIALIDHSAGFEATPHRVRLGDLADFFKDVAIFLRGEDKEVRNARRVEFVEYAPSVIDEELARLTRRGANAWKDVPDATTWVDELRGLTPGGADRALFCCASFP